MPNTTPNLGLIKPLVTEQYDIAKVTNENADILDLEVSSKQDILVSGTSIKTINSTSLLGSGDLAVQEVLVSGTNIKTINSDSILSNGDLELLPKNNPISTGLHDLQGGQIKFPSTQIPSADVNTLDDYEEGIFTPTYYGGTTAGVTTYTTQSGSYIKIGKLVFVSIQITFSSATGTGQMKIGGLPFQIDSAYGGIPLWYYGSTVAGQLYALPMSGGIGLDIFALNNGSLSTPNVSNVSGEFRISFCYFSD